jgi:Helix-turn-helix of DDE superfamily endonuclease
MPTKQGSYIWLKKLNKKQFKRLVGVTLKVYKLMVKVIEEYEAEKTAGHKSKLSPEDKVLMTLQYLREYPSLLRLGIDWGIHESTGQRIVTKTEELLLESKDFHLPGRKAVRESHWDIVILDVAETPMERPKKNSVVTTQVRKIPGGKSATTDEPGRSGFTTWKDIL